MYGCLEKYTLLLLEKRLLKSLNHLNCIILPVLQKCDKGHQAYLWIAETRNANALS